MNNFHKYEKYLYVILLIGIIIYFPILFNGFVWDDFTFIINNAGMHQLNFIHLISQNEFNYGPFYRPIPAIYFAFLYVLFGQHALFYHIIQIVLHIVDTSLLFLFFCFFFEERISFFLALVFLVHPINVESIAYIGASQSELYFLPGITALLLAKKKQLTQKRLAIIILLLLFSVLTKETGFLFIIMVLLMRYILRLGIVKELLLGTVFIGILYAFLRVKIGQVTYHPAMEVPIAQLSLSERLINIPSIFIYYIKTFFFPMQLVVWQIWIIHSVTFKDVIFPLVLCILFFVGLLYLTILLYRNFKRTSTLEQIHKKNQNKKITVQLGENNNRFLQFIFFAFWFLFGSGMILQLVPLDMTVADRWFYFPIVGLLGMIGVVLQRFLPSIKLHYKFYFYVTIIILSLFSLRTVVRTFDWKNEIQLFTHDLNYEKNNYFIMINLAKDYDSIGQHATALNYQQKVISIYVDIASLNELGVMYEYSKQYDNAIAIFTRAIKMSENKQYIDKDKNSPATYANLAFTYLLKGNSKNAIDFITKTALKKFPNNAQLYSMLAIAQSQQGNHLEAVAAAKNALQLSSDNDTKSVYFRIINNIPISTSL